MIRDLLIDAPCEEPPADVCIVGAGAAGITLAVELARRGKRVTLLEGGGSVVEERCQSPYLSCVAGLPHRGLHSGRVRALGGTTTSWGGQILELDEMVFEGRPWIAESSWPFPKRALDAYYRRALEVEGLEQAIPDDAEVWRNVGVTQPQFAGMESYLSRWCPEPDFSVLHRRALQSETIAVWTHANAVEVIRAEEHVTGVRCRTQAGKEAIFHATAYCFCLGAIESSRFFLQASAGRLPWNRSGLLGQHFQDHIDCDAAIVEPHNPREFHRLFDSIYLRGVKYHPKLKLDAATQREHCLLQAGATFFTVSDAAWAMQTMKRAAKQVLRGRVSELTAKEVTAVVRQLPTLARQTYRYAVEHRAYHVPGAEIRMRVHCEQEPTSASFITLCTERDELGLLRTRLTWKISTHETHTLREFVRVASEGLRGVATVRPLGALDPACDSLVQQCEDSFHHMGGMRMHASPHRGVVDTDLKLHGTSNLYVCSSAVFPSSGFSNPTHTLIALAARLADHLTK